MDTDRRIAAFYPCSSCPSVVKRIKNHGWTQMNTDERPDLRRAAESKLLFRAETEKISGFAFEVWNEVGHGLYDYLSYPCPSCPSVVAA